jgi:hypothetical protein
VIVRKVIKEDFDQVVALGEEFALLSQKIHKFTVSRKKIEDFANMIITNPICVGIVLEDEEGIIRGILAAMVLKTYFSDDDILQELAWYVKDNRGGLRMLLELEKQAEILGVKCIAMGYKPDYVDMSPIYDRMGYKLLECEYLKRIG